MAPQAKKKELSLGTRHCSILSGDGGFKMILKVRTFTRGGGSFLHLFHVQCQLAKSASNSHPQCYWQAQ